MRGLTSLFRVTLGWRELLRRTAIEMYEDNCLGLAAQLAYYFFLALFPALLFLIALASFFPLERLVPQLVETASPFLPEDVVRILREQIAKISDGNHGGILTFGLAAALWSSSAAMTAIIDALNRAYGVDDTRPLWKVRLRAIALTVVLALFILVAFAAVLVGPDLVARLLPVGETVFTGLWWVLRWPVVFVLIAVGIGLVYHFAPDVPRAWTWLTPGSLLAAIAWMLASLGFRLYIVRFGTYTETYGAIGGVMVLLLWLYLTGLAILAGAELNSEIEHARPHDRASAANAARRPGPAPGGWHAPTASVAGPGASLGPTAPPPWPWLAAGALVLVGLLGGKVSRNLRHRS